MMIRKVNHLKNMIVYMSMIYLLESRNTYLEELEHKLLNMLIIIIYEKYLCDCIVLRPFKRNERQLNAMKNVALK